MRSNSILVIPQREKEHLPLNWIGIVRVEEESNMILRFLALNSWMNGISFYKNGNNFEKNRVKDKTSFWVD